MTYCVLKVSDEFVLIAYSALKVSDELHVDCVLCIEG